MGYFTGGPFLKYYWIVFQSVVLLLAPFILL